MDRNTHDPTGELEAVARRLSDERPQATGLELDRIKQKAISQASARSWAPKKGLFMKPRIAVAFILAMGLLTSGTGATLAVISESGSAARVQYPDLKPNKTVKPDRLGSDELGAGASVQEEEQVASSGGGELPFTGFLAIPLLIVGVLFLVAGGVLRSRAGRDQVG
ncbi:MAG: hypothetical protein QOJ22_424 [Thermoleophilaceae bacterium]|jgi:hypothetical protein|nr:hypothetical protein [Thermoleophilaceae bacterium]